MSPFLFFSRKLSVCAYLHLFFSLDLSPGKGLTLDPPRGVTAVELNQGDTKSGRIARSDVARVCVESIYRCGLFWICVD